MKYTILAALIAFGLAIQAQAADRYVLDRSHSQVIFSYDHLGFSTTFGMFSGFEGELMLDKDNPAASAVNVFIKAQSLITGWDRRDGHFTGGDFFDAGKHPLVTFKSTHVEVTGDTTAKITGDLTMNGITKSIDLDAKLNKMGNHPRSQKPWAGFTANTTVNRSEWDMGMAAPFVSDAVDLTISVEAMLAN